MKRIKGISRTVNKRGDRIYEPHDIFEYRNSNGKVIATIKSSYWQSGVQSSYHHWRVILQIDDTLWMKASKGFGERSRNNALRRRREELEELHEHLKRFIEEGVDPPAWLRG